MPWAWVDGYSEPEEEKADIVESKASKKKYRKEIGRKNFVVSEEEFIDDSTWDSFNRDSDKMIKLEVLDEIIGRYKETNALSTREFAIIKSMSFRLKIHFRIKLKKLGLKEKPFEDPASYYTLLDGGYLGEYFEFLPNGRIDKQVTGIGATYLELSSNRNSIIVEPLKSIASMKAKKHNAIYVGSPTILHPDKIDIKDIEEAINKVEGKPVKIISVADSLWKVMEAIGKTKNDYFFMIDEIDTFQSDAGYREKLERVIDRYFEFENRCVLSATLRDFSNPKLKKEPLTVYDYKDKKKEHFNLTITQPKNVDNIVAEIIELIAKKGERVLIAYNSVIGILNIIEKLTEDTQSKCSVLCSKSSESRVQEYYYEFGKDFSLSTPITFMTSAYFSGIDLDEKYHLICVVNAKASTTILSIERIKQILGRARNGTLSNHVICSTNPNYKRKEYSEKLLLTYAQKTIKALECVEHVYSKDESSLKLMNQIRNAMVDGAKVKGYKLVRKKNQDSKNVYAPAYFNIDALLSNEKAMSELYVEMTDIKSKLEQHYIIDRLVHSFPFDVEDDSKKKVKEEIQRNRNIELAEVIEQLNDPQFRANELKSLIKVAKGYKKQLFLQYSKLIALLSKEDALEYLENLNKDKRDSRDFNNFYQALVFLALEDTQIFKSKVLEAFPLSTLHTKEDILFKLNAIHARADVGFMELSSHTKAVRQLKLYFKVEKLKPSEQRKEVVYRIDGLNPKGIKIKKKLGTGQKNRAMFRGLAF